MLTYFEPIVTGGNCFYEIFLIIRGKIEKYAWHSQFITPARRASGNGGCRA